MEEIKYLLENYKGQLYDLCYIILESHPDNQEAVFEYMCKNFKVAPPQDSQTDTEPKISQEDVEQLGVLCAGIVNMVLSIAISLCAKGELLAENFYKHLWVSYSSVFPKLKERALCMFYTIRDVRVPYRALGCPLSMTNAQYHELVIKNAAILEDINYIVSTRYTQRTEWASLFLKCLDRVKAFEDKCVILSEGTRMLEQLQRQIPMQ